MNDELYELIHRLVDGAVKEHQIEVHFRELLTSASEDERTEAAYLIEDLLNSHPGVPYGAQIGLERVERYIGNRLRIADYKVRKTALDLELEALCDELENECGLLDDDDDLTII